MDQAASPRSLERSIVKHAAPTLAGMKPASLFSCPVPFGSLEESYRRCQTRLAERDVSLAALAKRPGSTLLFVSRDALLRQAIGRGEACRYLRGEGYDPECLASCLACLREKIARSDRSGRASCTFPHEIGLFLGYPFEDVMAFIRKDAECVACGCWMAFGDETQARAQFERYRACTARLTALYDEGAPIEDLARLDPAA